MDSKNWFFDVYFCLWRYEKLETEDPERRRQEAAVEELVRINHKIVSKYKINRKVLIKYKINHNIVSKYKINHNFLITYKSNHTKVSKYKINHKILRHITLYNILLHHNIVTESQVQCWVNVTVFAKVCLLIGLLLEITRLVVRLFVTMAKMALYTGIWSLTAS